MDSAHALEDGTGKSDIKGMTSAPQQQEVSRMAAAVGIAITLLIAAIFISNFYLSLVLGVAGAATFVFAILQLRGYRKLLAAERHARH